MFKPYAKPYVIFKAILVEEDGTHREVEMHEPLVAWHSVDGRVTSGETRSNMRVAAPSSSHTDGDNA